MWTLSTCSCYTECWVGHQCTRVQVSLFLLEQTFSQNCLIWKETVSPSLDLQCLQGYAYRGYYECDMPRSACCTAQSELMSDTTQAERYRFSHTPMPGHGPKSSGSMG